MCRKAYWLVDADEDEQRQQKKVEGRLDKLAVARDQRGFNAESCTRQLAQVVADLEKPPLEKDVQAFHNVLRLLLVVDDQSRACHRQVLALGHLTPSLERRTLIVDTLSSLTTSEKALHEAACKLHEQLDRSRSEVRQDPALLASFEDPADIK